jgi:hypothetical protein
MLRVLGLFFVTAGSSYIALNNGVVVGYDLTQIPLYMIGIFLATGGLIFSLRYI